MNRLGTSKSFNMVKNLPGAQEQVPAALKNLVVGQLAFFGFYQLVSGPNQMKLKRYFTVTPSSGAQSLATFHLFHTSVVPLAVNVTALMTLGAYHCRTAGLSSFLRLFGVGCAAASLAVALDARSNPNQT